ncbi:MAG: hypothetical protein ABI763_11975 [Bacteroidota bacterium]
MYLILFADNYDQLCKHSDLWSKLQNATNFIRLGLALFVPFRKAEVPNGQY